MSNIIYIANPGEDNDIYTLVNSAVSSAVDDDIIVLPAGNFKWDGAISTTKRISLWGCTTGGKTTLYVPEATSDATVNSRIHMFKWDFTSRTTTMNSGIVVKSISFKSKYPSFTPSDGGSQALDIALDFKFVNDFVVRDCEFRYFGNTAIQVKHRDTYARGLICNNYFSTAKTYTGLGFGYGVTVYGEYTTWVASPQFGSSNFIFIEDNIFNEFRHSIASNGGSLFVPRYNYILNNIVSLAAAIDTHPQADGPIGSRAMEAYGNRIVCTHHRIHNWANSAARTAFVPYHASDDYGIQTDTGVLYRSNGLSAGNWIVASIPKGNHLGAPLINGKSVTTVGETAINMRGGENLIHNNTITNWRFGVGVSNPQGYSGAYPIPYGIGYASGVALGSGHTGSTAPNDDGDLFEWNNTFTPYVYGGSGSTSKFYNYSPTYYVTGRDYQEETSKTSYIPYIYPHPLKYR